MKKIFITALIASTAIFIYGQENHNSGHVTYQTTKKIEIKLEGEFAHLADQLPKERKSENELLFNEEASIYRNIAKKQEDDAVKEAAGATFVFKSQGPEEFVYSDLKSKINTAQREFMSRQFLIESNTDTVQWKLTGNQKIILNLNCIEAELVGGSKKVTTWFAPTIPVSTGPDGYSGLPGLILALDIDNGKTTITAQSVDFRNVDSSEITIPKNGKKVTLIEYNEIVEEKMKEMKENSGGGVIIYKSR
jgi:GLPGLI family protein